MVCVISVLFICASLVLLVGYDVPGHLVHFFSSTNSFTAELHGRNQNVNHKVKHLKMPTY